MAYRALSLLDDDMIVSRRGVLNADSLCARGPESQLQFGRRRQGRCWSQATRSDTSVDGGTGGLQQWLERGALGCHWSYS